MKTKLFKSVSVLTMLLMCAMSLCAQEASEVVNTNNSIWTLVLEIVLAVIGGCAAVYFCWRVAVNINKKKEEKKTSTTGTQSPVANIDTHGTNSDINNQGGIMGNNNTIQNGLSVDDVLKLTGKGQPSQAVFLTDLEQDKKLVDKFFSRFSHRLFKEFIAMRNPAYLDNRILDMRDGWYDLYNPIEPAFIDVETKDIFGEFFKAFDSLSLKCAYAYDISSNPKLGHIHGMVGDSFDDPKDEAKFDEIVEGIKAITPIYDKLIKFVVKKYKIDLDDTSNKFEERFKD